MKGCLLDNWLAQECGAPDMASLPAHVARRRMEALRATLVWAARHSRFYQRRLAGMNLDIRREEDMRRLPFTTAQDLRQWGDFLCVSQGDVRRMVTLPTSGSTGEPKRLAFTDGDLARTREFFAVGMAQLTASGQRVVVLLPGAARPDGVSDLLRQALEPAGVRVYAGDAACTAESLRADMLCWRPHCLVATPGQLRALCRHAAQDAVLRELTGELRGVLASGEVLDATVRAEVTALSGNCLLLDHYGLTEAGLGGGVQCPAQEGYHWRELDVWPEIVDMRSGEPLPCGAQGELVITTLRREAMPLVRYRTGDVTALLPGPCPCGSPLRRLAPIAGRVPPPNPAGETTPVIVPKGQYTTRYVADTV